MHSHARHASMFAVAHRPIPAAIDEFVVYVGGDVPAMDQAYRLYTLALAGRAHLSPMNPLRAAGERPTSVHLAAGTLGTAAWSAARRRSCSCGRGPRVGR